MTSIFRFWKRMASYWNTEVWFLWKERVKWKHSLFVEERHPDSVGMNKDRPKTESLLLPLCLAWYKPEDARLFVEQKVILKRIIISSIKFTDKNHGNDYDHIISSYIFTGPGDILTSPSPKQTRTGSYRRSENNKEAWPHGKATSAFHRTPIKFKYYTRKLLQSSLFLFSHM